jgi:mannose-1-phosphate guanylyltransferase
MGFAADEPVPIEGRALVKAVVLVGGEGTRLRPLTETMPKPLIPLMDRRSLDMVLDHLAAHGVHEVILSSPYLEETFGPFIRGRHGDPVITWITEAEPLGTGGAIVNALDRIDGEEPVFALNGDILTDLDLSAMLAFHGQKRASVTIALHRVEDARPFGLVMTDGDARVQEFREKPQEIVPGDINAGTYVLDPAVLHASARGENISIERQIFPSLIAEGRPVFGFLSAPYWLDLGTPEKYLQAHFDILEGRLSGLRYDAPWIAPDADVDLGAHLGRWVVVGAGASVGAGAEIDDSVLHPGARVGANARVIGSILGPDARVGDGATVDGCVLAEGASVGDRAVLRSVKVSAGQRMPAADEGP